MIAQLHERIAHFKDLKPQPAILSLVKSDASTANDGNVALHLILIDVDEDGEDYIGPEEAGME